MEKRQTKKIEAPVRHTEHIPFPSRGPRRGMPILVSEASGTLADEASGGPYLSAQPRRATASPLSHTGCNGLACWHACVLVYKLAEQSTNARACRMPAFPVRASASSSVVGSLTGTRRPRLIKNTTVIFATAPSTLVVRTEYTNVRMAHMHCTTCICVSSVASLYPLDLSPHTATQNRALHFLL